MKKTLLLLLMLGNIIMAATIHNIKVNGTKIPMIVEKDQRLPLVTMQLIFQSSGSIADTKKAGLAKLSAKMMNEGTKKLGSSKFAEALESKAIHISAQTGRETFVLELGCLKEELDEGLRYLEMLLKDPNLTERTLQKVKTTTLGMLARKENDFDYIASSELKALLFDGSVLANPSAGTVQSVQSIKLQDVEEFLAKHLVSSRLIVAAGGDINAAEMETKITKIITSMPKGNLRKLTKIEAAKEAKEKIVFKETQQAYIYFGSPYDIDINSKDYYKARVATFILGAGGFGSRLMEEIRVKKGLAYSAYARLDVTQSSSYMSGYLQTKLDSLEDAKETIKTVVQEFVKEGVSKEELKQTKKFLLGSEPLRVETMSQRLQRAFLEFYNDQEIGHTFKELEKIEKLKLKELNAFIQKHTEILNMSFAIVTKE